MINFQFGNKKPDKREIIKVSIIVSLLIAALSTFTGISETKLWDLLDDLQRKYLPLGILNELIIKDPEKLERRVTKDVDNAIENAINEYDEIIKQSDFIYKPRYVEEKNDDKLCYTEDCKKIAPPMRICSPWNDDCPKN